VSLWAVAVAVFAPLAARAHAASSVARADPQTLRMYTFGRLVVAVYVSLAAASFVLPAGTSKA